MSHDHFKTLSTKHFKAHLCAHLRALEGEDAPDYLLTRYKTPVAVVLSKRGMDQRRRVQREVEQYRLHCAARARHAEERRVIAARALSWPPEKFACLRRLPVEW